MNRRRGLSLVELVVVMSACAVLLTLCAAFLQRAFLAQMRSRTAAQMQLTLFRLDQSFRADVHTALTAETDPEQLLPGVLLRLENAKNEVIEYRWQENSLERVQLAAGGVQARDTFSFPRAIDPQASQPEPRLVVLSIETDDALDVDSPPVQALIEAALPRVRVATRVVREAAHD